MDERRRSITDFMTDGALAALCDALSRLTGARVELHDRDGRLIEPRPGGRPPWRVDGRMDTALSAALEARGGAPDEFPWGDGLAAPLMVSREPIGALLVACPPSDGSKRDMLARAVALLASTVGEMCEQNTSLRQRHAELGLLYRLSSLLVAAWDVREIVEVALRSAVEVFQMDAGTVHLLDDERVNLVLAAHTGLSQRFVEKSASFPVGMVRDKEALAGRTVCVADLLSEGRALLLDEIEREGLVGRVSTGLVFNDRALGIMRLYRRAPATLDPTGNALLQTIAEQVATAVASARLLESDRKRRMLQRQLQLAADVQRRMLPVATPDVPRLDIAARYVPSLELGGDFYDLIPLGGSLGLVVGDVVGKGVPAALLMASVRASLRAHAADVYDLDEVMSRVNRALARDTRDNEFATVFFGVIDPRTLRLTYCNAGHDPPVAVRLPAPAGDGAAGAQDVRTWDLTTGGLVVGVDDAAGYERAVFDMQPGDVLVAYTDGLVDAMNFEGRKYGRARFLQSLRSFLPANPGAAARQIADHIVWDMRRYIGLAEPHDDITVVVVRALPRS